MQEHTGGGDRVGVQNHCSKRKEQPNEHMRAKAQGMRSKKLN